MFEISLVPDVKFEMLRKQKLRNFIIFICLIVVAACAGVIVILLITVSIQGVHLNDQDNEIACRADGDRLPDGKTKAKCTSEFGTPVMKYQNMNELLTIQSQMSNINALNQNKMKFSRIFGVLDVILFKGDDLMEISEINADAASSTIRFEVVGHSAVANGYVTLQSWKESVKSSYIDYGNYQRIDAETGEYVNIPSFCMTEEVEPATGYVIGTYHKGIPGCEAPLVFKSYTMAGDGLFPDEEDKVEDEEESDSDNKSIYLVYFLENCGDEEGEESEVDEDGKKQCTKWIKQEDIKILRSYKTQDMLSDYKNGKYVDTNGTEYSNVGKYFFSSNCIQYNDKGAFDESATKEQCPLLSEEANVRNESWGRNSSGEFLLTFTASLNLNPSVFRAANHHMQVIGPSRQNVTDSYVQIRDMFTQADEVVEKIGG